MRSARVKLRYTGRVTLRERDKESITSKKKKKIKETKSYKQHHTDHASLLSVALLQPAQLCQRQFSGDGRRQ